jgi:hypothetical protein
MTAVVAEDGAAGSPAGQTHQGGQQHIRWPAEQFYWAVLDAAALAARSRPRHTLLGYLFENVLPGLAIEDLHAIYRRVPASSSEYIACALPRCTLAEIPEAAMTLAPVAVPEFIQRRLGATESIASINLLTGPFTPRPIRRLRQSLAWIATASIALCAAMLVCGAQRRIRAMELEIARILDLQASVYQRVLGPDGAAGASPQPHELRLLAELRHLEQTRSAAAPDLKAENCAASLANLVALWPLDLHMQTESMMMTADSITVRGQAPAMADAQALADALAGLQGWRMAQPQSEARQDHVDLTLRLDRMPAKGPS